MSRLNPSLIRCTIYKVENMKPDSDMSWIPAVARHFGWKRKCFNSMIPEKLRQANKHKN